MYAKRDMEEYLNRLSDYIDAVDRDNLRLREDIVAYKKQIEQLESLSDESINYLIERNKVRRIAENLRDKYEPETKFEWEIKEDA